MTDKIVAKPEPKKKRAPKSQRKHVRKQKSEARRNAPLTTR